MALVVSRLFPAPAERIQDFLMEIRVPRGAREAHEIGVR
jgi:hypothetical protein